VTCGTNLAEPPFDLINTERVMNRISSLRFTAVAGAALLAMGCAPDDGTVGQAGRDAGREQAPSAAQDRGPDAEVRTGPPGAGGAGNPPAGNSADFVARAEMLPVGESGVRGTVEFRNGGAVPLMVNVTMSGLPAGPHGFHVHEGTDCAMPGEHWNPTMSTHGDPTAPATQRHRGDLGNVTADASGNVQVILRDSLLGSDRSYVGKVLVVHTMQDDLRSQPSGESGDPVACGVIEVSDGATLSQAPGSDRGV
jgi:Cu-Zn family superoxide dismutase